MGIEYRSGRSNQRGGERHILQKIKNRRKLSRKKNLSLSLSVARAFKRDGLQVVLTSLRGTGSELQVTPMTELQSSSCSSVSQNRVDSFDLVGIVMGSVGIGILGCMDLFFERHQQNPVSEKGEIEKWQF